MSQHWLKQAERDLSVARRMAMDGFYEWACYAAQQAAEKAVKAVRMALGTQIDTIKKHEMSELLAEIPVRHPRWDPMLAQASVLDAHIIASRYPGHRGKGPDAPCDTYKITDAFGAIAIADAIVAFCKPLVAQIDTFWTNL